MKIHIKKREFIESICLLILCIPITVENISFLASIVKYLKWGCLLYALYIIGEKENKISKLDVPIYIWFSFSFITVLINGTSIYGWFSKFYPFIAVYIISRDLLKKNAIYGVKLFTVFFSGLIIGNYITWIFPGDKLIDELGETIYLLGIRTRVTDLAFIAISICFISILISRKAIWKFFLILTTFCTLAFCIGEWVSTAIAAFFIYIILLYLGIIKPNFFKRIKYVLLFLVILLAYLIIVVRVQDRMAWFIIQFLGEDLTLNGRTIIWDSLISQLNGIHWLFGNGLNSGLVFSISTRTTATAHSQFLYIVFNFGLLGLILFLITPIYSIIRLFKTSDKKINAILIVTLFVLLFAGITENTCDTNYYYIFLAFMASSNLIKVPTFKRITGRTG